MVVRAQHLGNAELEVVEVDVRAAAGAGEEPAPGVLRRTAVVVDDETAFGVAEPEAVLVRPA